MFVTSVEFIELKDATQGTRKKRMKDNNKSTQRRIEWVGGTQLKLR